MTINEQIKILDNKIRSTQAQYDLDRKNAKISALSSGELDRYKKDDLVINAQNFFDGREMIIEALKNKLFPFYSGNYYHDLGEEETSENNNEDISPRGATAASPRSSLDPSKCSSPINDEGIDPKIIKHYFGFNSLNEIYKFLN